MTETTPGRTQDGERALRLDRDHVFHSWSAQSADAAVSLTAASKQQLGRTTESARSQLAVAGTLSRAAYAGE